MNTHPNQNNPTTLDDHEEVGDIYSVEIGPDGQIESAEKLSLRPQIWVGSLADYNAGRLHGDWLDAAVPDDLLAASVRVILAGSTEPDAEEYGIFDYEQFGAFRVGEYEQLDVVARVARGIQEHGPAFAAWAELHDADPDMLAGYEDAYLGHYDTIEDWAREVLLDATLEAELDRAVPDTLRTYVSIDYAAFARDCQIGGDIYVETAEGGGVWIFHAR